jgi:hypothetical protein
VPEAIPARRTGTEPVSEWDAGVPARPTPTPMKAYAAAISQYTESSPQTTSIHRKARSREA